VSDGYSWWCRQCNGCKTLKEGSFISKSKLNLLFQLVLWDKDTPVVTHAIVDAEIDTHTGVDIAISVAICGKCAQQNCCMHPLFLEDHGPLSR